MHIKTFELRDRMTFLAVLCVSMDVQPGEGSKRNWLLRRCGYDLAESPPTIMLTNLAGGQDAHNDPFEWGDRTYQTAHLYIQRHWNELADGAVIDVEYILKETTTVKESEQTYDLSNPLS